MGAFASDPARRCSLELLNTYIHYILLKYAPYATSIWMPALLYEALLLSQKGNARPYVVLPYHSYADSITWEPALTIGLH